MLQATLSVGQGHCADAQWMPIAEQGPRFLTSSASLSPGGGSFASVGHIFVYTIKRSDVTIDSGKVLSREGLKRRRRLLELESAIDTLAGQNAKLEHRPSISQATRVNAKFFLVNLPENIPFPKISPDGESGLHLYWSEGRERVVAVDDYHLHGVDYAGTANAKYVDDVLYYGGEIPGDILNLLA
jgi:hypothetical protein